MDNHEKKLKADGIRKRVEVIFRRMTDECAQIDKQVHPMAFDGEERVSDDVQDFSETLLEILDNLLRPDTVKMVVFDDDLVGLLRRFLLHRVFRTYPCWHLKPDMSDDEVIAAAEGVADLLESGLDGLPDDAADRLETFRDPADKVEASTSMGADYQAYRIWLQNLSFYLYCCSVLSRDCGSFAAGRLFLKCISRLSLRRESAFPHFTEEEAETFLADLEEAHEELSIALDYRGLPDWTSFRQSAAEQMKSVREKAAAAREAQ